jgi:hypothetical protein
VSGMPFTSERQLTGEGLAESTATIVHHTLLELGVEDDVLLWNVVPTHPGSATSNRRPTAAEIGAGTPYARLLARNRTVVAVGRVADRALGLTGIRHPSYGGARAFRAGLVEFLAW